MKTATILATLLLALLFAMPAGAQTTTLTFDGINNLSTGEIGSYSNPTSRGTRIINAYPIIANFGGEAHYQSGCGGHQSYDRGALSIYDRQSGRGQNFALFYEDPRDYMIFGPFPTGVSANNILFTMYRENSGAVGRIRVSALDANLLPYPGTGSPADSSAEQWVVESSTPTLVSYSGVIPAGGYVMFRRVSLYGGTGGSCPYPSGNFMIDDISFTPNPVPVELTAFRCTVLDEKVRLNWTTATELNNFGFEVERSMDRENWSSLGFVLGHGTSFSPKQYDYMDVDPDWSAGVLYYRLRQVDRDGTTDYSPIVRADRIGASAEGFGMNIFPQPFSSSLQVQLSAREETHMLVTLYNSLLQEVATLHDGMVLGTVNASHPTDNLLDGNYFVVLRAGDQAPIVRKIVKLGTR